MKAIPCKKWPRNWRSHTTLCTTPSTEQHILALTRIERVVGGPGAQLSKRTSTLEYRRLSCPQLPASLNSPLKSPVSTVNRRLRDAGLWLLEDLDNDEWVLGVSWQTCLLSPSLLSSSFNINVDLKELPGCLHSLWGGYFTLDSEQDFSEGLFGRCI